MKKIIILIGFIVLLSFKTNDSDKTYSVSLSVNQWQTDINILEAAKGVIKQSNIPVNIALPLVDSLTKIQNEFMLQLRPQIDSTNKK